MEVRFRLVDVFTEAPFAGNQLCVVTAPPPELDAATMQILAREIGFSETTFVTEAGGGRYSVRIFTPVEELPFAGHPTLGTAATLADEGRIEPEAIQTTIAGRCRWRWTREPGSRGCVSCPCPSVRSSLTGTPSGAPPA